MIVVLDTNVFVSALLSSKGSPAEIIRRWEADEFEIVISPALIDELTRALTYPQVTKYLKKPQEEIDAFLKRLSLVATMVQPEMSLEVIQDDVDDNRVLECALAGGASYIVTGDRHLLNLKEYEQMIILNPSGFVTTLDLTV